MTCWWILFHVFQKINLPILIPQGQMVLSNMLKLTQTAKWHKAARVCSRCLAEHNMHLKNIMDITVAIVCYVKNEKKNRNSIKRCKVFFCAKQSCRCQHRSGINRNLIHWVHTQTCALIMCSAHCMYLFYFLVLSLRSSYSAQLLMTQLSLTLIHVHSVLLWLHFSDDENPVSNPDSTNRSCPIVFKIHILEHACL